jgi:hypothetical protein
VTRAFARDLIAGAVSRTLLERVLSLVAFVAALCGLRFTLAAWLVRGFFGMARVWVAFPGPCTIVELVVFVASSLGG